MSDRVSPKRKSPREKKRKMTKHKPRRKSQKKPKEPVVIERVKEAITSADKELVPFEVTEDQKVGMNDICDIISQNLAIHQKWTLVKDFDGIFMKKMNLESIKISEIDNNAKLLDDITTLMIKGNWLIFDFEFTPVSLDKIIESETIPTELFLPKYVFDLEESKKIFSHPIDTNFKIILVSRSTECDPVVYSKFCVVSVDGDKYRAEKEEVLMMKRVGTIKDPRIILKEHKFIEACFEGNIEIVKESLYNGVDPNCKNEHQNTGLMEAALNGQLEVCKLIVSLCKLELDINATNESLKTALHKAAYNNHLDIIMMLLVNGADPNLHDEVGNRPIDISEDK